MLENDKDLKYALTEASGERIQVGRRKPITELDIAADKMSASVKLNCSENYLKENHSVIIGNILCMYCKK
ncbi:hypothetical protein ACWGJQ_04525 [Peribacillus simplex]